MEDEYNSICYELFSDIFFTLFIETKMNSFPLVSVLIPLYNAEQYIEDTIIRLKKQTYPNIEVIIVDDHSTDKSLKIAQKYVSEQVHVYVNPKRGGNSARNYAFLQSRGEYVKFIDADDFCSDNMIKSQMERILSEGTRQTVVFSPVRMYYPDGQLFVPPRGIDRDYVPSIELLLDIWRGKGFNCPHCHLMHRSLVNKVNGWNENIIKNQDGEFFARIYAAADKALAVDSEYAVWWQTGSGVSTQMSLRAIESVCETHCIISDLIYSYRNDEETRKICGRFIGAYVFFNYPLIKPLLPQIETYCEKTNTVLYFPKQRRISILKALLGWKIAAIIINKYLK